MTDVMYEKKFHMTKQKYIWMLCIAVLSFSALWFAYEQAFDASFYFDTGFHLVKRTNYHIKNFELETLNQAMRADFGRRIYRPVSGLSFSLNYYFTKLNPYWLRTVNFVVLLLSAFALTFMLKEIFSCERIKKHHPTVYQYALPMAAFAALLWAIHPIQSNVVIYIIQRMASLAGLFSFLCVGSFVAARKAVGRRAIAWAVLSGLSLLLALGSKENTLVLFPLLVVVELMLFEQSASRKYRVIAFSLAAIVIVGVIVFVAWRGGHYFKIMEAVAAKREFTTFERVLTQMRLQFWYIFLLLVPDPRALAFDAEIQVSKSLFDPMTTFMAFSAIIGMLTLALSWVRKRPLLTLGILWFLVSQVVEATILPLELFFEHRMYIPSVFIFAGISALVFLALEKFPGKKAAIALCASAVVVLMIGGVAYRSNLWSSPVRFYMDMVEKAPGKIRPNLSLALALVDEGKFDAARYFFDKAREIEGDSAFYDFNYAFMHFVEGDVEKAEELLVRSVESRSSLSAKSYYLLGWINYKKGKYEEAEEFLRKSIKVIRFRPQPWNMLGAIQITRGELDEAEKSFKKAVKFNYAGAVALNNLSILYEKKEEYDEALTYLNKALEESPGDAKLLKRLEIVVGKINGNGAGTEQEGAD